MSQFFDDSSTTMGDAAAGIPAPAAASARPDPRRANLLRLVPLDWDGDAVELALDAAPRPLSAEELAGAVPTVFSDRPYRIECSGPMLMRLAAVTLDLNDELILCRMTRREGLVVFATPDNPMIFESVFGLAKLVVELRRPDSTEPEVYHAPPVHVLLPKGERAESISLMALKVARASDRLFQISGAAADAAQETSSEKAIQNQAEALERVVQLYERHYSYFRTNARTKLAEKEQVGAFAKLKSFTQKTLEFIVRHPEELEPSPGGRGVRPNGVGEAWMPRRTLIQSAEASFNTYENQALVGFLTSLAREVDAEASIFQTAAEKLPDARLAAPEGYLPSTSAVFAECSKRLETAAERFRTLRGRLTELHALYARTLGIQGERHPWPLKPTPVFLAIAPYREIFEALSVWRNAPPPGLLEGDMLLACMAKSRLYEYYVLAELIEAFEARGFELKKAERFEYQGAEGLTTGADDRQHANTFHFEKSGARITLWYQPVLSAGIYAGENGIGLARTTAWSIAQGPDAQDALRPSERPFYTPDFVVKVEAPGRSAQDAASYLVADAKFSRMQSVIAQQTMSLVFRYLFSIRPIRPEDRHAGLWILCGADAGSGAEGELTASPLMPTGAAMNGPAFILERFDPKAQAGAFVKAAVDELERLQS